MTTAAMRPDTPFSPWWDDLRTAAGMLTRLPLGPAAEDANLARAGRAMPLVGALIGAAGAFAFWIADGLGLPPLLAGLIAVGATVLLTGAFHEDGLADVADGFGGGFERERKLAIMRASDIGSYGVIALIFSVALRVGALAALAGPGSVAAALIAAHALARGLLPPVMANVPLARPDGMAARVGQPAQADAMTALAIGGVIAILALGLGGGILAVLVAVGAAALVAALARAQIGGYTGDVLGAVEQAAETAILLVAVVLS